MRFDWWAEPRETLTNYGRTVYLLGTAEKGPIREPVLIREPDQASKIFGNTGTLARAAADLLTMNPRASVYCFRVSGIYGKLDLMIPVEQTDGSIAPEIGLTLRSVDGSDADNQLGVQMIDYDDSRTLLAIVDQEGRVRRSYWLHDYSFLGDLVRTINTDASAGLCPVVAATDQPLMEPTLLREYAGSRVMYLAGADSQVNLTKDELFLALEEAYDMLKGRPMDVVLPLGAFMDDAYSVSYYGSSQYSQAVYGSADDRLTLWDTEKDRPATFHGQLAEFCAEQERLGWMTHGVIGMRPLDDPLAQQDPDGYVTRLVQETALGDRTGLVEGEGEKAIDRGGYVSIVINDFLYQAGTYDEHWDTAAIGYAAVLTGLDGEYTTTNKPVPGNPPQRVEFETETLKDLAFMGIVAFRNSVKQQALVVYNGVTAALPDSDLHQIANVRMVQLTLSVLNDYLRELKGRNMNELILSNEVPKHLTEILDQLKVAGILTDYRFTHTFLRPRRMLSVALTFRVRNMVDEISAIGESMLM